MHQESTIMRKSDQLPFVSVIVPHYNDIDNLHRSIGRIQRQTWPRDLYEIIIADNNSIAEVAAEVRRIPGVVVVPAPEQGAGPARNAAVAVSRGQILAFIDSDCFANETWLAEGISALSRFDYVGGKVTIPPLDQYRATPCEAYDVVFGFDFQKYIETDKFSGTGNLFVPRTVFDKVGLFRHGVSEDKDWCWRANALGFRLGYAPAAIVHHPPRRKWKELARKWDRMIAETYELAIETPGWRWRWPMRIILTAMSPVVHAPRIVFTRKLRGFRSKINGLFGLVAIRLYRAGRMIFHHRRHQSARSLSR